MRFAVAQALLAAAASASAQTPADSFDFRDASLPDTEARMRACVGRPQWDAKRTAELARQMSSASETSLPDAPAVIASQRGRWACVPRTTAGYPLWPLEALDNIASTPGIEPQALRGWREAMLAQIGKSGHALGLIKWPNGNGLEVDVEVQPGSALRAKWRTRHLPAGGYDAAAYPVVVDGTGLKSVRSTQMGNGPWYSVVPSQALHWPVVDNYPVLTGTADTTAERLTGTTWSRDADRLKLEADGRVTLTAARPRTGTWRVAAGLLQLQWNDQGYETLRVVNDGLQLAGIQRRTQPATVNEPAHEFQNGSVFDLVRTTQAQAALAAAATAASAPPAPAAVPPAPTVASAAVQHIALLLRFERDLKGVGAPADAEALLAAPGRALWSDDRVRALGTAPARLQGPELIALLAANRRLADQVMPFLTTASKAYEVDPGRYGEVYLNLTDLLMRLMAGQVQLAKRAQAQNPNADSSAQASATVMVMQSSLQSIVRARRAELPRLPGPLQARASSRLTELEQEFPEAMESLDKPAR